MQIVARVLNLGLGVVVTALVVRLLGQGGYGQWSTALIVLGLVGFFSNFGAETIAVREAARDPGHELEWIGAVIMLRLLTLAPVMLLAGVAIVLLQQSQPMLLAGFILIAAIPFDSISGLQLIFQLRVNNFVPMVMLTLRSLLWGVGVAIAFLGGGGLVVLAVAMALTNAVVSIVQAVVALRMMDGRPKPTRRHLGPLLRTALPVGISGLLIMAYARVDQIIVFEVVGSKSAGLYGSVYNILDQAHFVPMSILTTLAPVIAAAWPSDRARMLRAARQTGDLMAIASFGALAFAIVASTSLVRLFFGEEFVAAAPALPVLGGAFVFICFGYLNGNLLVVLGLQNRLMLVSVLALIVNVVGNLIFVPVSGFMAAAWMTLATEVVVFAISLALIVRKLAIPIPRPGRIGRTALAAALLGGGLALTQSAGASLAVLIVAACVAYPALLLALGAVDMNDVRVLLRRERLAT